MHGSSWGEWNRKLSLGAGRLYHGRYKALLPPKAYGPEIWPLVLNDFFYPLRHGATAVGHNLVKYDLPGLSGILMRHGLEPLGDVRYVDTMPTDKVNGFQGKGLAEIAQQLGAGMPKGHMQPHDWEDFYLWDWPDISPARKQLLRDYQEADVRLLPIILDLERDRGWHPAAGVWKASR